MFENVDEEIEKVDQNMTRLMFSMCQECRFMAAVKAIDSIDKHFIGELRQYTKDRLNDKVNDYWSAPESEPGHRSGGCHVLI